MRTAQTHVRNLLSGKISSIFYMNNFEREKRKMISFQS